QALGIDPSAVSRILSGDRGLKLSEVQRAAAYLGVEPEPTPGEILPRGFAEAAAFGLPTYQAGGPGQGLTLDVTPGKRRNAARAGVVPLPPRAGMERDLEVRGTAVGGEDAAFEFNGETVEYVCRPPGLTGNRKAFALYVVGESMSPRFEEGELVFVHPGRPAKPGNDVVVELHGRDGEAGNCYIKRLVARTPSKLVLSQFNPAKNIDFPLAQVRNVLRILTPGELLGS
ncbi:MAG: S24 family peptidase, partial [Pseudomonadota bacterium]